MVASPTFNILGMGSDAADGTDNYDFGVSSAKPNHMSPSQEFSLVEQHDELTLTSQSPNCPSSARCLDGSSPRKIRREISFHSCSSDLFSERQREANQNPAEERRTRQISSITEHTIVGSTQHSDDQNLNDCS